MFIVISNIFCTVYISSNFCATVCGQYVTFIQDILVEAAQSLMFQCLAHNMLAKVQARPEELLRQNGGHNEHTVH
jgi:hypothetical protein